MKHTHVIEAATAEDFREQVYELYHAIYSHGGLADPAKQVKEDTTAAAPEEKPAGSTGGKKGKKQKEESASAGAVAATPTAPPTSAPVAAETPVSTPDASSDDIFGGTEPKAPVAVPYTMEDCQKRLQTVVTKTNITKAKELLAKFNIAKLVELKPDQFNGFIAAADELTP